MKPLIRNGTRSNLIFVILSVLLIIGYAFYRESQINKFGVFTIAKVERFKGASSGSTLYITVYLGGKTYNTSVGNPCRRCIGKFYFVKVLKQNPTKHVIFYNESPVPYCILRNPIPEDGWEKLPSCENSLLQ